MSGARTFIRNLACNWGAHLANLVVMFFLSPFIVHSLGKVDFGVWTLIVTITGYMGVLDIGIRASTGRFVILYVGKEDPQGVRSILQNSLGFFLLMTAVIVPISIGLGWVFPALFEKVPEGYATLLSIVMPIMALNIAITAGSRGISSVLDAHDRFDLSRAVAVLSLILRSAAIVAVLHAGMGLEGLAGATILSHVFPLLLIYWVAKKVYPPLSFWPPTLERSRLKEMFGYGIPAFLYGVCHRIVNQTDLIVVGVLIGVGQVSVYSFGIMLVLYSWGFLEQINSVFFPPVQRAAAQGKDGELRYLVIRSIRSSCMIGLPVLIGLCFFGQEFLVLWLGPDFAEAGIVVIFLAIAKIVKSLWSGIGSALAAKGMVKMNTITGLVAAGVNLGLSLFFVMVLDLGLMGVALGTLVSQLLIEPAYVFSYALRKLGMSVRQYIWDILWPSCVFAIVYSAACYTANAVHPSYHWGTFFAKALIAGSVGFVLSGAFLLLPPDKQRIRNAFATAMRKVAGGAGIGGSRS